MIEKLIENFSKKNVLVIGDMMIDAYLSGKVSRISPEAPVPIVDIDDRTYRLGGAANVAVNLLSLGANPLLCSVIGNDEKGTILLDLMKEKGLTTRGIVKSDSRRTTLKYRIIGNKSQMLRIDEEDQHLLSDIENEKLLDIIQRTLNDNKIDAIIIEDYDKGVLTRDNIHAIIELAKAKNVIVTVDPKKRNFTFYQYVTMFKPNLKELKQGMHCEDASTSMETVEKLMRAYCHENHMKYLFTTLSERGVALYDNDNDKFYHYPAYLRQISDVSGAGDTVIAVATLCMTLGLPMDKTIQIANLSGGIVCEYAGVVPIPLQRLMEEIKKNNLL